VFQLELVLVVEKLQELRSIRIQKLKKQGMLDKFLFLFYLLCACLL
jgi:hypothetical protein